MDIKLHTDDTTQPDYKFGAVDIITDNPAEAVFLGEILERMSVKGIRCTKDTHTGRAVLRLPLTLIRIQSTSNSKEACDG